MLAGFQKIVDDILQQRRPTHENPEVSEGEQNRDSHTELGSRKRSGKLSEDVILLSYVVGICSGGVLNDESDRGNGGSFAHKAGD
jgi:hypothetical protein